MLDTARCACHCHDSFCLSCGCWHHPRPHPIAARLRRWWARTRRRT